jgi:hypothetical protein
VLVVWLRREIGAVVSEHVEDDIPSGVWGSENFWQPPGRSWPYPPTRLDRLAARMGIEDEEFRELLRAEIERRLHERVSAATENRAAHS